MRTRGLVWGVALTTLVWLLLARRAELAHVLAALRGAHAGPLLVAAALQAVYWLGYARLYHAAFAAVGVPLRTMALLEASLAALPLNLVAAGSGNALYLTAAARAGQSGSRAVAGAVLVRVADFASLAALVAYALIYLARHHHLAAYELLAGLGLLGLIAGWGALLGLGIWAPARLTRLLDWVRRQVDGLAARLRRPAPLGEAWAEHVAADYTTAARTLTARPAALWPVLGWAVVINVVELACLAAVCWAFGLHLPLGLLVTAFAIGILFWIVAVTPQGVGIVEGSMALVLHGAGYEAAVATGLALAYRGLSFWLPLLVGWALLPRFAQRRPAYAAAAARPARRRRRRALPPLIAACLCAALGVINIVSAITPAIAARLAFIEDWLPTAMHHGGRLAAVVAGGALLVWAGGLARGKRVAWAGAMAALIVAIGANLIKGWDYEEALLSALLLVYLVVYRDWFPAHSDRRGAWFGLSALGLALTFTVAYGTFGLWLLDRHFHLAYGFRAALGQTLAMFFYFSDPGLQPVTALGRWFADSIYWIAGIAFAVALLALLRPVLWRGPSTAADRARATAIVEAHGRSALARFTLFDDKRYWFSPGGSLVAYVVKNRVALALGDPIGPADDLPTALDQWLAVCAQNDWRPAFYEVMPDLKEAYEQHGLTAICTGHDAIVDLAGWTLAGKARANLRNTANRFERDGWRTEVVEPPLDDALLAALGRISDTWLRLKAGNEKRFALGWFDPDYLRAGAVMVLRDAEGEPHAFANLVPEYQLNELTIDLMRHDEDAPGGAMEALFIALIRWAAEQGYDSFNLGLSALSGVGEQQDDPAIERVLHLIYEHFNRFYGFQGLHTFKSKFGPRWEPRYLIVPSLAALPAVWRAIMRANGGEDFLAAYLRPRQDSGPPPPKQTPGDDQ